jgi:hypothetical protein
LDLRKLSDANLGGAVEDTQLSIDRLDSNFQKQFNIYQKNLVFHLIICFCFFSTKIGLAAKVPNVSAKIGDMTPRIAACVSAHGNHFE